jgi:hypothetical protein
MVFLLSGVIGSDPAARAMYAKKNECQTTGFVLVFQGIRIFCYSDGAWSMCRPNEFSRKKYTDKKMGYADISVVLWAAVGKCMSVFVCKKFFAKRKRYETI